MLGVSNRLSFTDGGSSTNASLGGESGVVDDVTHIGPGPGILDATQPAGRAGGTTPSKFSLNTIPGHGVPLPAAVAVAVAVAADVLVAVAVAVGLGVGPQGPFAL